MFEMYKSEVSDHFEYT